MAVTLANVGQAVVPFKILDNVPCGMSVNLASSACVTFSRSISVFIYDVSKAIHPRKLIYSVMYRIFFFGYLHALTKSLLWVYYTLNKRSCNMCKVQEPPPVHHGGTRKKNRPIIRTANR